MQRDKKNKNGTKKTDIRDKKNDISVWCVCVVVWFVWFVCCCCVVLFCCAVLCAVVLLFLGVLCVVCCVLF